jgi:hypothetical protein
VGALLQTLRAASAEDIPAEQGFHAANRSKKAPQNARKKTLVLLKMALLTFLAIQKHSAAMARSDNECTRPHQPKNTDQYSRTKSELPQPTTSDWTPYQEPVVGPLGIHIDTSIDTYCLSKL